MNILTIVFGLKLEYMYYDRRFLIDDKPMMCFKVNDDVLCIDHLIELNVYERAKKKFSWQF